MIQVLPLSRVLTFFAVTYGLIIAVILSLSEGSVFENIGIALGGSTTLHLSLLLFIYAGWRFLWKKIPVLNQLIFPDLNGNWEMDIKWMDDHGGSGDASGIATIKMDFFKVSMEVKTEISNSVTLCVRPSKNTESSSPSLHYFYSVTPKFKSGNNIKALEAYNGSAILIYDHNHQDTLEGNYFTDRFTRGHFTLHRIK